MVVAEAKMVLTGLEAKFWRDDLSAFVQGPQCYAAKFHRKIAWVCDQRGHADALPRAGQDVCHGLPCVSLTEFLLDFEAAGR